jgi:hypothetical protein
MWYTYIHNPKTKIVALLTRDYTLHYVEVEIHATISKIKKITNAIAIAQYSLFDGCSAFLQQTYAIHRIFFARKRTEELTVASIVKYKERRLEVSERRSEEDEIFEATN